MDLLIYGTLYDFDNIKIEIRYFDQYFMYYLYIVFNEIKRCVVFFGLFEQVLLSKKFQKVSHPTMKVHSKFT